MRERTGGQTPECSSHTFRHHPGAHLHPCAAGSSQELGITCSCCRVPSTPVIPAAMRFYHQGLKSQVFRLQSKDCLYSLWGELSPQELLFLAVCRFGITSGLYYLSVTTGKFLFFKQWTSGWCSGRNSHQESMLVCQTTTTNPSLTVQSLGVQCSLGPWHCTAKCLFGEQITQFNLEQPLLLLPTTTHKITFLFFWLLSYLQIKALEFLLPTSSKGYFYPSHTIREKRTKYTSE